jgi:hypothetical protein
MRKICTTNHLLGAIMQTQVFAPLSVHQLQLKPVNSCNRRRSVHYQTVMGSLQYRAGGYMKMSRGFELQLVSSSSCSSLLSELQDTEFAGLHLIGSLHYIFSQILVVILSIYLFDFTINLLYIYGVC